jgi:hypothetical protein
LDYYWGCPISLACQDALPNYIAMVHPDYIGLYLRQPDLCPADIDREPDYIYYLPPMVTAYIDAFDSDVPVTPWSFTANFTPFTAPCPTPLSTTPPRPTTRLAMLLTPQQIIVTITRQNIAKGEPDTIGFCPIALALRRQLPDYTPEVWPDRLYLFPRQPPWTGGADPEYDAFPENHDQLLLYQLPPMVEKWINAYDKGQPVTPFSFSANFTPSRIDRPYQQQPS